MSIQELLSVLQVAQLFRVAPQKIRDWIASGELKALNVREPSKRPCWRIDPRDADKFRQAKSTKAKAKRKHRSAVQANDERFV